MSGGLFVPELVFAKTVYLVDFMYRQQSYVLKGSYDRLLPFLHSSYRYSENQSKQWIQQIKENLRESVASKSIISYTPPIKVRIVEID